MNLIFKLLPFLRAYRNHPIVQKYKRPVIGCVGCASVVVITFTILIIILLFQIIGGLGDNLYLHEFKDQSIAIFDRICQTISNLLN